MACQFEACPVCAGCGACRDFHGYTGRGCTDDNCPYRWYHRVRDFFRRFMVREVA